MGQNEKNVTNYEAFDEEKADKTDCYSVSQLTKMIQNCLEDFFPTIWIQGEISNFTAHRSGHWYFTLKDSTSQIKIVMFRSMNQQVTWKPEGGLEVKLKGNLSVYKPRGEYQIICHHIQKLGKGAAQEELEKLKIKLKKKGLFERKKPLPFLPKNIAIISSPSGAAIRDIFNILKRRYKGVNAILIPALVQGEKAPESLIEALAMAKKLPQIDVLIVTRGGGSAEDLQAFNDERLAEALFDFPLPVISAVGHEIDFSICDFVADLRAPTPSAAAELVMKNAEELMDRKDLLTKNLYKNFKRELQNLRSKLKNFHSVLINPARKIQDLQQYLDDLSLRLKQNLLIQNKNKKQNLSQVVSALNHLSPLKVLSRGYCLVSKKNKVIKGVQEIKTGEEVNVRFFKGFALAKILKTYQDKKEIPNGL